MAAPELEELRIGVERLELNLRARDDPYTQELMHAYTDLLRRLTASDSERDQLLSRRGALLMAQQLVERQPEGSR